MFPEKPNGDWRKKPRSKPSQVDGHKYSEPIIELLAAGWAPHTINTQLARMYPDYEPVHHDTLNWYRRERIDLDRLRPLEEFERKLRDEHTLLDPVRGRAALIILQQARVQKALQLEAQLTGVILPIAGEEIERLSKLWAAYEGTLESMGMTVPSPAVINAPHQQVNILNLDGIPPEIRAQFADALTRAREARAAERMAQVQARVDASLPDPDPDIVTPLNALSSVTDISPDPTSQ